MYFSELSLAQKATATCFPNMDLNLIEDCPKCFGSGERIPDIDCITCKGTGIKDWEELIKDDETITPKK